MRESLKLTYKIVYTGIIKNILIIFYFYALKIFWFSVQQKGQQTTFLRLKRGTENPVLHSLQKQKTHLESSLKSSFTIFSNSIAICFFAFTIARCSTRCINFVSSPFLLKNPS